MILNKSSNNFSKAIVIFINIYFLRKEKNALFKENTLNNAFDDKQIFILNLHTYKRRKHKANSQ